MIDKIEALDGVVGVIIGQSYGGKSLGQKSRTGAVKVQRTDTAGIKAVTQSAKGLQELFIRTESGKEQAIAERIKALHLNGFNRVATHRAFGQTEPFELIKFDIDTMMAMGARMTRIAHHAQSPELLDYCDEVGMLIIEEIPGVTNFTDLKILETLETDKTIWIAGGGEIYKQLLPKCSDLYLTRVHRTVEGDAFFPQFEDAFQLNETVHETEDFSIEHWTRK